MPDGWIILDKPLGLGSTQAVSAVKRNLREAGYGKVKVGHGGTLDPLATGVLPIALGEATKLAGRMLDASKVYEFTVAFGVETDTLDREGAVIAESSVRPALAEIEAALAGFTGAIEQVPPAYSAIKVDGARAYDRARAGEAVELRSRLVTVYELRIAIVPTPPPASTSISRQAGGSSYPLPRGKRIGSAAALTPASPLAGEDSEASSQSKLAQLGEGSVAEITLTAHVSKGTYIRSLARDIARALGTVGHVTMLRRLRAGPFGVEQAISLDNLNAIGKGAALENVLLPLEAGLVDIPALNLGPEQASMVRQGRVLTGLPQTDGLHWARSGTVPVALLELVGGTATVVRGFNLFDVAE